MTNPMEDIGYESLVPFVGLYQSKTSQGRQTGGIENLFSLDNTFKVEFGWGGGTNVVISNLRMYDYGLDYEQQNRLFKLRLKMMPSSTILLSDIKLNMLDKEVIKFNRPVGRVKYRYTTRETGEVLVRDKVPDTLQPGINRKSLSNIITTILEECRRLVVEKSEARSSDYYNIIAKNQSPLYEHNSGMLLGMDDFSVSYEGSSITVDVSMPISQNLMEDISFPPQGVVMNVEGTKKDVVWAPLKSTYSTRDFVEKEKTGLESNFLLTARPEDIPDPNDIIIALFESANYPSVTEIYNSMFDNEIAKEDALEYCGNPDKHKDVSVLQFLNKLLGDNGFTILPNYSAVDGRGNIRWMIVQKDFNGIGSVVEKEYTGIKTKSSPSTNGVVGFVHGFSDNDNGPKIFDIHSSRSIVKSIRTSIDNGESTEASSVMTQNIAEQGKLDTNKQRQEDKTISNPLHGMRNNIFYYLSKQAKTIEMETLGIPRLKNFDSITVYLAGVLFSGVYKILEMKHTISSSDGFSTSIMAVQTYGAASSENIVEKGATPQSNKDNITSSIPKVSVSKYPESDSGIRGSFSIR